MNFSLACSIWPVPPVTTPGPLDAAGAPPLLVVGTTDDPATPLFSAQSLARELDASGLLVAKGEQHTSFAIGNGCVDRAVTRYLVNRKLPGPRHPLLTQGPVRQPSLVSFQICSAGHRRAHRRSQP